MTKIKNGISFTLLGLLVATLGVVATILWDLWSSSAEISLTTEHSAIIVEKKRNVEKLVILYNGQQVDTLSKTTFELKNTGRKAITHDDLISYPKVILTEGNILDAELSDSIPKNIDKKLELNRNIVSLTFKLLNPGDLIIFSVLSDTKNPTFASSARIKNVKELRVVKGEERIKIDGNVGFWVYVVGAFSLLFFMVFLALLAEIPKLRKQLSAIKNNETPLHKGESIDVVLSYIDIDLSMLTTSKREKIKQLIPQNVDTLSEVESKKLVAEVHSVLRSESPGGGAILALILAVIGAWYVYSSVFI